MLARPCRLGSCAGRRPAAAAPRRPRGGAVRGLKENVAGLPPIDGIAAVTLQPLGHRIPNEPGKKASVAIYAHLASRHGGVLTQDAAREGLALYAEVVDDARAHRGSHPNIDILLDVVEPPTQQQQQLTIVVEAAG